MIWGAFLVGAREWVIPAISIGSIALLAVAYAYWRAPARPGVRALAALLKATAVAALALCLIEPLFSDKRPKAGANLFVILADNSQSLQMHDSGARRSRADVLKTRLDENRNWQVRLNQDFDVRKYAFDRRLRHFDNASELAFDGSGSLLGTALSTLSERFRGRALAGILLFTDGIATDAVNEQLDALAGDASMPPVYPVPLGQDSAVRDVRIEHVAVTETRFEEAPVTILAEIASTGYDRAELVAELVTPDGEVLETRTVESKDPNEAALVRFQFRPREPGVQFYQVRVSAAGDQAFAQSPRSDETTLANNSRLAMVSQSPGPYRVLYVSGRPNWEFKFLRRALQQDREVELVGLIRIARREAKFDFRGHLEENTNPLYRGFGEQADQPAEQYDEPVILRLGTRDEFELRNGFPREAEELFSYDAIVLDDVEAAFFSQDQLSLIQKFVSQRGGGFMMLGGMESFYAGDYQHTPIADLLPVYLDAAPRTATDDRFRQMLTREGLLQPWVRLRSTEEAEQRRLNAMPAFRTLNRVDSIKPGATVLSYVRDTRGEEYPAMVIQSYGRGRTLALAVGDLWRWKLQRPVEEPAELEVAWRQTLRWLVADVPQRVEVRVQPSDDQPDAPVRLRVATRDPSYEPLDNARIQLQVTAPDGQAIRLTAAPSEQEPGVYETSYVPSQRGAYRVAVTATAADGSDVGTAASGWTSEPGLSEYRTLEPQPELLEQLARRTGGETVEASDLAQFVASLPDRESVITQPWIYPFWHQWWIFSLALACLVGEWGLRRWKGLP